MRFANRRDAGRQLAAKLVERYANVDGAVYGLPRGGVVLAAEIAWELRVPLDIVIARKVGHPQNPEYAIGAVTESGEPVRSPYAVDDVPEVWFQQQVAHEREEARRRRQRYAGGRAPLSAAGKTAIVVDDGIATGLTMEAAIGALRLQQPVRMVLAIPVMPADTFARLARKVDEIVALEVAHDYLGSVGAYYGEFSQVSDEEVVALLERSRAPTE